MNSGSSAMASLWQKLINRASNKALNRLEDDENYVFVRQSRLFNDLSTEALLFVMSNLMERHYKMGEVIFREGNPGICLFLVKSGQVEIYTQADNPDDKSTVYATINKGTLFGEISIISMAYRTSSARAIDYDTTLLTLSAYVIAQLLEQFPHDGVKVVRGVTDSIISHLISTDQRLRETAHQVKILNKKLAKYE
jgi:CRP/FNR family cyclic AMP-dependent transcriptional regulator